MNETAIEFKKIYEHDIDLLMIEEFLSDRNFARLFLDKLQLSDNYTVCKASHSLSDSDGESDITLILQYPDKKVAVLIEDKIDAPTMSEQSERYRKRAQTAISRGEYDVPYIMLAAPADYIREHRDDSNAAYPYSICYEELRDHFRKQPDPRSAFKAAMIDHALKEKKAGYQVSEVPAVTVFWIKLRQFCKENYPQLDFVGKVAPKGAASGWPEFRTSLGTIKVVYKSQKGYVDLEFPKYGDKTGVLRSIIGDRMKPFMLIRPAGKSASVRIKNENWILDFSQDFETHKDTVAEILQAVSSLCDFASTLNYSELY